MLPIRIISRFCKAANNLDCKDKGRFPISSKKSELPQAASNFPIRERGGDILLLADFFFNRYTVKYNRPELRLDERAKEKLLAYPWPGNVRELQHNIERAVILCEQDTVKADDLIVQNTRTSFSTDTTNLEQIERQVIETTIARNNGNPSLQ